MANHPLNLTLRFLLELLALFSLGYYGWTQHSGFTRFFLAIGLPLLAAIAWVTLRVPGFPGDAPIAVPGPVRLIVEAAVFGGAILALFASARGAWGLAFALVVLAHYLLSYDYVIALLK